MRRGRVNDHSNEFIYLTQVWYYHSNTVLHQECISRNATYRNRIRGRESLILFHFINVTKNYNWLRISLLVGQNFFMHVYVYYPSVESFSADIFSMSTFYFLPHICIFCAMRMKRLSQLRRSSQIHILYTKVTYRLLCGHIFMSFVSIENICMWLSGIKCEPEF